MKKLFLLVSMIAIPFSVFAIGPESDSSGTLVPLELLLLWTFGFGIFGVVLYFKIWIAADDIRRLKKEFCLDDDSEYAIKEKVLGYYLQGEEEKAYTYLNDKFVKYIYADARKNGGWSFRRNKNEKFKKDMEENIQFFTPFYKSINREIPERFKTVTLDLIYNFGEEQKEKFEKK